MPRIGGSTQNESQIRSFIQEQATGNKTKGKQARFDKSSGVIYSKGSGMGTFKAKSKLQRHEKIEGLKNKMLEKFGPSHRSAIESVFAKQTTQVSNGKTVYKNAPTFQELNEAIKIGDSTQKAISDFQESKAQFQRTGNYLSVTDRLKLSSNFQKVESAIQDGDFEKADYLLNEASGDSAIKTLLSKSQSRANEAAEDLRQQKIKLAKQEKSNATQQLNELQQKASNVWSRLNPSTRKKIESALWAVDQHMSSGRYREANQLMSQNLPGTSLTASQFLDALDQTLPQQQTRQLPVNTSRTQRRGRPGPDNPQAYHHSKVISHLQMQGKRVVFGGDDGNCFYGAVATSMQKSMPEVRKDLHNYAVDLLKNNSSDFLFNELVREDLQHAVDSEAILKEGYAGDYGFARLVAECYHRPVKMVSYDIELGKPIEKTFEPLNVQGQSIEMAFNGNSSNPRQGGHFDCVV